MSLPKETDPRALARWLIRVHTIDKPCGRTSQELMDYYLETLRNFQQWSGLGKKEIKMTIIRSQGVRAAWSRREFARPNERTRRIMSRAASRLPKR